MNRNNRLAQALMVAVLGTAALAGCKKNEAPAVTPPQAAEPTPMPPGSAFAATPSVSGVELGNAVDADMKVVAPMSSFGTRDTIHASIATTTSDPAATVPGSLGVKWSHVDSGQVVHEETKDVTFSGNGNTDFQISKPDGWPTGKYRLEVTLNGAVVQTREFEVR